MIAGSAWGAPTSIALPAGAASTLERDTPVFSSRCIRVRIRARSEHFGPRRVPTDQAHGATMPDLAGRTAPRRGHHHEIVAEAGARHPERARPRPALSVVFRRGGCGLCLHLRAAARPAGHSAPLDRAMSRSLGHVDRRSVARSDRVARAIPGVQRESRPLRGHADRLVRDAAAPADSVPAAVVSVLGRAVGHPAVGLLRGGTRALRSSPRSSHRYRHSRRRRGGGRRSSIPGHCRAE